MWFNNERKSSYVNPRPTERLCYDCSYCMGRGKTDNEMIYCRWDDVEYYPETGIHCEDFKKS